MLRGWMMAVALLIACNGDDKGTTGDDTDGGETDSPTELTRAETIMGLTADTTSGQALYADTCALCHGADGTGGIGTDLVSALAMSSDDQRKEMWIQIVIDGIDGTTMGAYGEDYSDQELADLIGYVFDSFGP